MNSQNTKIPLALPVPGFRRGLLGNLPVDAAYLRGVESRGRMLARACRPQSSPVLVAVASALPVDQVPLTLPDSQSSGNQ